MCAPRRVSLSRAGVVVARVRACACVCMWLCSRNVCGFSRGWPAGEGRRQSQYGPGGAQTPATSQCEMSPAAHGVQENPTSRRRRRRRLHLALGRTRRESRQFFFFREFPKFPAKSTKSGGGGGGESSRGSSMATSISARSLLPRSMNYL